MKSTAVDEKIVYIESTVLFQRKSTSTIATTEWEIYIEFSLNVNAKNEFCFWQLVTDYKVVCKFKFGYL